MIQNAVQFNYLVDSLSIHFFCEINFWRCKTISELMINEQIKDKEVRLIGEDGEQLGIMPAREAMKIAREAELDLVKIAPTEIGRASCRERV